MIARALAFGFGLLLALDKAVAAGVTAVEIGAGGYPGSHHCPVDELLASQAKREAYLEAIYFGRRSKSIWYD